MSCATICVGWLSIPREVLIHIRMAMYFWEPCFLSRWLFVSFRVWRNVWGHARAWDSDQVQPKGRTGKEKGQRLCTRPCYMLHVLSYVSLAGKAKNERVRNRKCSEYIVTMSRDWFQTHDLSCTGKVECADVVGSTKHVISLSNRFPKLINLPTPSAFISGINESWIL